MAGANTLQFTQDNFEQEVLNADVPVLVDFWAQWCTPCLAMAPTIDKVKVGKVDTDSSGALAARFGISAIPTTILFNGGQPAKKFVGLTGKKDFKQLLDEALQ